MKSLRVLLIDENPGRAASLEQALRDAGHDVLLHPANACNVLDQVEKIRPDIVLIDMASPDRDVLEHLRGMPQEHAKPVVLFAEHSDDAVFAAALRAGVSAYVVDAINPQLLKSIMQVAISQFEEYQALRQELADVRVRLAERKLIDKAKGMLMQQKNLTEEAAYNMLRKLAMDRNQRLGEVARNVISVLDLLG
ncbi:MAG: ANTAR domain-containing protein [Gammaproteobacteria bacterium]